MREWWIYPQKGPTSTAYSAKDITANVELVHVVEKSALDAANAKIKRLEAALEKFYERDRKEAFEGKGAVGYEASK